MFGVGASFDGFEVGGGRVGAGDNGLANIDAAGLVFAKTVERLVDDARCGGLAMDEGEVGFMNFPALLHFAKEGGVFLPPSHEQEAAGFAVEPTDEGKKFLGIVVAKPVDEGEGAIGPGRVNQPTGGLIHDQERGMIEDDGGFHEMDFEEM